MSVTFDGSALADGEALQRVRAGHPAAFGVLYERHLPSARRLARSLVSSPADADDIVAEVFAATFAAIRRGRGPEADFAPYLLRSIRRECQRTWRRTSPQRQTSLEVTGEDVEPEHGDDYARTDEAQVLHDAFAALPSKMRNVLWQVEVEGLSHDEIARRTRSSAPAVAQLVVRARRALGERYLHAHLGGGEPSAVPADCARARSALAEYVRGTTSPTLRHVVAEHLETCGACREARDHLELVNERLRGVLGLTLATTALAPRPWLVGVVVRATNWVFGPTVPLTVATGLAVVGVVAPPAVFELDPPEAAAAAPTPGVPTDGPGTGGEGAGFRDASDTTGDAAADDVDAAMFERPTAASVDDAAPAAPPPAALDPTITDVSLAGPVTAMPAPATVARPAADVATPSAAPGAPVTDVVAPVTDVVEPVSDVVEPVSDIVAPVLDAVEPVTDVVAPVLEAVEPVTDVVSPVLDVADPILEPVAGVLAPVTETVADIATPVTEAVADVVTPVTEPIAQVVEPVAETVADVVTPVTEPIAQVVEPATETVEPVAEPIAQVVGPVAETVEPVAETVTPVTDALAGLPDLGG